MSQMIVTVNSLNRRSSPVVNVSDKSNIVNTVSKGFTFDSTNEINNKAGTWYEDSNGFYYWGGGVSPQPIVTDQPVVTPAGGFSLQQIQMATGALNKYAQIFMPFINNTCSRYQINTPIRALCFFAQMGHESGGLFFTEELASGSEYEGRSDLGNTEPGDGVKYKGRGLIQITGRVNYSALSADFGIDLVSSPAFLAGRNTNLCTEEQLKNSAFSAGWFWNKHNLSPIADQMDLKLSIEENGNMELFTKITRIINGGTNGINDRVSRFMAGQRFFL